MKTDINTHICIYAISEVEVGSIFITPKFDFVHSSQPIEILVVLLLLEEEIENPHKKTCRRIDKNHTTSSEPHRETALNTHIQTHRRL